MKHTFDAIVIGSGFGGAVSACRLAEAGYRVLVLERGRRWDKREFPRSIGQVKHAMWRDNVPYNPTKLRGPQTTILAANLVFQFAVAAAGRPA